MDGMRFNDRRKNTPLKNQPLTFRDNNFMSVDDSTSIMSSPADGKMRNSMKVRRVWDKDVGSQNLISKYAKDEPLDNIDSISDS